MHTTGMSVGSSIASGMASAITTGHPTSNVKYCTILSITAAFFREKETFRQAQSRKCRAGYRDVAQTTIGV
jgi:hypothetical protein